MDNSSLQKFDTDIEGLELVIDQATGDVYASQSATARMCGVKSENTIRHFVTSQQIETKTAEVLTTTGLKTSQLLDENAILQALAKYNPALLAQCAKAGLRVYLYGLAGYKAKDALSLPGNYLEALEALVAKEKSYQLAQEQIKLLEEATERQAEVIDELFDYSSIIRVAKYNGCHEKAFSWHRLKTAAKTIGEEIKKAPCPRYGEKNLYSHNTWRLAYPEYRLPETTTIRIL